MALNDGDVVSTVGTAAETQEVGETTAPAGVDTPVHCPFGPGVDRASKSDNKRFFLLHSIPNLSWHTLRIKGYQGNKGNGHQHADSAGVFMVCLRTCQTGAAAASSEHGSRHVISYSWMDRRR